MTEEEGIKTAGSVDRSVSGAGYCREVSAEAVQYGQNVSFTLSLGHCHKINVYDLERPTSTPAVSGRALGLPTVVTLAPGTSFTRVHVCFDVRVL